MSSINIDDEKRLIVSIKDISSLDTSIGENQVVTADTSDINYIPGYVEAEKQRRENEAERKAYYQEIKEKVNNGEFKGEKGDKGEPGPKGDDGAPGEPGTTDYNELQNKPTIPSKTSDLVNDSDFVNSSDLSYKQDKLIAGANITIEDNVISSTGGSGTGGTTDYTELANKPKINGVTLSGNKTLSELGIQGKGNYLESESDPVYTADKPNIALKTELFSRNYNDLTNKPNIPTKVSDLTNDSGFINSIPDEYITETELNKKGYLTEHQDISGKVDKEKGKGLSTNDFTTEEKTKLAGIEAGAEVNKVTSVNNQTGDVTITVPDKISDLTNDKGYITNYTETDPIYMADKPNIALKSEIPNNDDFSLSGLNEKSYNNLTDKPSIPTKTSELTNDSDYVSDSDYVHTDNNFTTGEKEKLENVDLPTVLYDNPTGATTGISLLESITHFKKIKLYFLTEDAHSGCDEAYSNGKMQIIFSIFRGSVTGTNIPTLYIKTARITITDTSATIDRQGAFDLKTGNNNNAFTRGTAVKITRIEGYERITGE